MSLDGTTSWIERPVRRISGSDRFNPLPHAGTISVFLLIVVVVSGLYITLFFQYGYEASYTSVLRMEEHPIQRVIRALHRYSSAALVLTTVVHSWRIFVAGRFGPRRRRWRWLTGVATLLLLWPAGVTGYLLVWDVRAAAVADAIGRTLGFFGGGIALWARHLTGSSGASGSTFMVIVWLTHLGLTVIVGYFAYRHLRRSKLAWLPSQHWMLAMGGALLTVSVLMPAGMLAAHDPTRVGLRLPLDPFVLFLLPVLESGWRWPGLVALTVLAGAVAALSFLVQPSRSTAGGVSPADAEPPPVRVLDDACTGCDLCVVDCPYDALTLRKRPDDKQDGRSGSFHQYLAVVDTAACTSCGICLGSCAFGALTFDNLTVDGADPAADSAATTGLTLTADEVAGQSVIVACDRHAAGLDRLATGPVQLVRCAGIVGPDLVKRLDADGAVGVDIIGCAVDDCRYGIGNTLAAARVDGERAPQVPRGRRAMVTSRWLAPGDLTSLQHAPPPPEAGSSRRALVGSSVLVMASMLAVALATTAPFTNESDRAHVRVVVDQDPSLGLAGADDFVEAVDRLDVRIGGESVGVRPTARWRQDVVAVEEWSVAPTSARVEVVAIGATRELTVFSEQVDLTANRRLDVPVRSSALAPVAEVGREVFFARRSGCAVCHSVEPGDDGVGPSLSGVATRAGTRVEGLDAATYLWQSILLPDQYVVEGYPAGQMLPIYRERLSQEELDALIAYLLTLTDSAETGGNRDTSGDTDKANNDGGGS